MVAQIELKKETMDEVCTGCVSLCMYVRMSEESSCVLS